MKSPIYWYVGKHCFWFRVCGYGLSFINRKKIAPLFSIRMGYKKEFKFFKYGVHTLTPKR